MKSAILVGIAGCFSAALSTATLGQVREQQHEQQSAQEQAPGRESADTLPAYEEGAAVILSGTIENMKDESFVLDYGEDQVNIDLEDWEWKNELAQRLSVGQQVTVSGTVDDSWSDEREIDAENIYVTTDYTYYYLLDESPAFAQQNRQQEQEDGTFISTRGKVTGIADKILTVESQGNTIKVDTSQLAYDPLDEEGVQRVKEGDRIYVFGDINENFFESKTIIAESLISLTQASQGVSDQDRGQDDQENGEQ